MDRNLGTDRCRGGPGGQAEEGTAEQNDSGHGFAAVVTLGKIAGSGDGADAADESAEFDDAVAPGKAALGQNFRKQSVFRRAEQGPFGADQKNARAFQRHAPQCKRGDMMRSRRRCSDYLRCAWSQAGCSRGG